MICSDNFSNVWVARNGYEKVKVEKNEKLSQSFVEKPCIIMLFLEKCKMYPQKYVENLGEMHKFRRDVENLSSFYVEKWIIIYSYSYC
jgi:hypothetical protein